MRLHSDLAPNESLRRQREQAMMDANQAYAEGNRFLLERLLLDAGEDPLGPLPRYAPSALRLPRNHRPRIVNGWCRRAPP